MKTMMIRLQFLWIVGYLSFFVSSSPGCDDLYTSLRSAAATGLYTPPTNPVDQEYDTHLQTIVKIQFLSVCESSLTSLQATEISRYLRSDQSKTNEIVISMIGRLLFRRNDVYSPTSRLFTDLTPKITDLRSTLTSILVGKVRVDQIDTVLGSLMDYSPTQQHAVFAEKVLDLFNYRTMDGHWGGMAMHQLTGDIYATNPSVSTVYQRAKTDVMYSFAVYRGMCSSFRSETLEAILKLVQSHTLLPKFLSTVIPLVVEKITYQLDKENLLQPSLPVSTPDNKPSPPPNNYDHSRRTTEGSNEKVPTVAEFMKNYKEPTINSGKTKSGTTRSTEATSKDNVPNNDNVKKIPTTLPETVPSASSSDDSVYSKVPKLVKYDLDNEL